MLRKDKHLQECIGEEIQVKLFKPMEGQKTYKGILKEFTKDTLTIFLEKEITIDRKNISQIKTVYNW